MKLRTLAFAGLLALAGSRSWGGGENILVRIDSPVPLDEPWPIACGVPFPQGAVKGAGEVSVVDGQGKPVPCQVDVTATWFSDRSARWALVHFLGRPDGRYAVRTGAAPAAGEGGLRVTETPQGVTISTAGAEFFVAAQDALPTRAAMGGRALIQDAGRGAYVVDQKGRVARLGGPASAMQTRFLARGPWWTVIRKEGWYVTDQGARLARGVVWLHFHGGAASVKIVHRLILTEDTNEVWFKDIGLDFATPATGERDAAFAVSRDAAAKPVTARLGAEDSAWMLQEDFPHFMSTASKFVVRRKSAAGEEELASGAACGDWMDVWSEGGGVTLVVRHLPEQFPKELEAAPGRVTARLWAGRPGRELDFRAATLMKDYWGEWAKYSSLTAEELASLPSNAQASAKTHTVWLLLRARQDMAAAARRAQAAAGRVLALADPAWVCAGGYLGAPCLAKDTARYPREEAYISDMFDRIALPQQVFPMTGYIAWGANPAVRYLWDEKAKKRYAVWWRINGLVDYHLRRNVWALYARSGERKYFDYGERFNRFAGDFNMHHWDCGDAAKDTRKVKGGFAATGGLPKGCPLAAKGPAASTGSMPVYWGWESAKPGGSGADVFNYLHQFYMTGDWDVWELAADFGEAVKRHEFLQTPAPAWGGGFVELRCLTGLYSMTWDETLGKMTRNLGRLAVDPDAATGVAGHFYKASRSAFSLIDYTRLVDDARARKALLKMVDYIFRFMLADRPMDYQSGSAALFAAASLMTGDAKYMRMAWSSVANELEDHKTPLAKLLAEGGDPPPFPYLAAHYNYYPLVGMPALLRARERFTGELSPLPLMTKSFDSTANAWAVFEKTAGQAAELEAYFYLVESAEAEPVVLGPDLKPVAGVEIVEKEKGLQGPVVASHTCYARLRLPAALPAGQYRLGQRDRGPFVVIAGSVSKIALECPEGFWLSMESIESPATWYFRPEPGAPVKVFVNRPVPILLPNGQQAKDVKGRKAGELEFPAGPDGLWSMRYPSTAFVRFVNVPPVAAYLAPERYFRPERTMPAGPSPAEEKPPAAGSYKTGRFGQAVQLGGRVVASISRGAARPDGGYERFPGMKGTIEFWFQPAWTATDFVFDPNIRRQIRLFSAGDVFLEYHRLQTTENQAKFNFICGKQTVKFKGNYARYGNSARVYPKAGEWLHLAATWDVDLAKKYDVWHRHFYVYVNGKKFDWVGGWPDIIRADGLVKRYEIVVPERIALGPGEGAFDELRISDCVRYTEDFKPPDKPFAPDGHTRILAHFDGSGETAAGGEPFVVQQNN